MHSGRARLLCLLTLVLLTACSGTPKPKPGPLEPLVPQIGGRMVWSARVDSVQFPLLVSVTGAAGAGVFTVGGTDGTVLALQAETGAELWRANVGAKLSAGVGSDGRYVAVVTRDNELVTLEAGRVIWRQRLGARVATAPLVAGERVFVLGVDRSVLAFDALDGKLLWNFTRAGDALTLAQAGVLSAFRDNLLVGQGNRLTALDPLKGLVRWEVPVASPRGTNEVERLADLIGPASRVGNVFCVRAFQNGVGCVDADKATAVWSINGGGGQPVAADEQYVFAADGVDRITARRRSSGETVWSSDKYQHRLLSGPISVGTTVVFGDFEGQVHFLSRETGDALLRLATDGSPIVGTPVRSGTTLAVATRDGGVFAFRPE